MSSIFQQLERSPPVFYAVRPIRGLYVLQSRMNVDTLAFGDKSLLCALSDTSAEFLGGVGVVLLNLGKIGNTAILKGPV